MWLVVLVWFATEAKAHSFLVSTAPQAGERLLASPGEVALHFSEVIVRGSQKVSVRSSSGRGVQLDRLEAVEGGVRVIAALPRLDEGVYVVTWKVLAEDGHTSAGEFAFAVGDAGELPAASMRTSDFAWPQSAATAVFLVGLGLALGGLASESFVWRRISQIPADPYRAPVAPGLVVSLIGAASEVGFLLVGEDSGINALTRRSGGLAAAEVLLVGYGLWIIRVPRFRVWSLLPVSGAALAAAFRGHLGRGDVWWWAGPANSAHMLLGALWLGALVHLVLALRHLEPESRRQALA
ncbi:MAG: copper resistance CopC family protein, partial [Candidatus Methylomirabilales bacterium]